MHGYRVAGRSAATAASANQAIAGFWNPHASHRVEITEIWIVKTAAGAAGDTVELRRSSARGTATSTVTPSIANDGNRSIAPPSGVLLDVTYSAQPTMEANGLGRWPLTNLVGAGVILPLAQTLVLPAGTGLVLNSVGNSFPASDITIVWTE